ncbi:transmembrane protein 109 isoform X2 [Scophthalmus maximus]|uniref:transmembrane protein 109 isoform X2 n=1 Tax=Scophthalmus maximus TaxID=52904 RepID=UPI000F2DE9EA|nr:transmembrane protein 109 isoform X2 [Scophthalmus maximus]
MVLTTSTAMTARASCSGRGGCAAARVLLAVSVLLLGSAGSGRGAAAEPAGDRAPAPAVTLRTLLAGTCQEVQRHVESVVGTGVLRSAAEFFGMVIRFLAEGAASGLNVIAVYVTEILRVTGFDVAKTLPRFTPEGVTSFAQWGLLALIGYWVLIVVLRLLFAVFRQVFWVVKTVLALWLFGLIVTDRTAAADITAVRLVGLVLVCALLTLLSSASEKSCAVEHRLSCLEGRLKAVEKRKGD